MAVLAMQPMAWAQESDGAPVALVERVVHEESGGVTRVTLFSNRIAVVSVRPKGERGRVVRRLLDEGTVDVYRSLLEEVMPGLQEEVASDQIPVGEGGILSLRLPNGGSLTLHFDPSRIPSLKLGKVLSALDDLQSQLLEGPQESVDVARWKPAVGDRVELWGGGTAVVTNIPQDGVVVLEHEDSPVIESLAVRDLPVRVRRLLSRRP